MSTTLIQPVILCGGAGTRLWPLSRADFPKQFLPLASELSLFQETLKRLMTLTSLPPMVVGNEAHRFIILEQALEIGIDPETILLEPESRNTAPALTLATLAVLQAGNDPVLLVMPADHAIADTKVFIDAVQHAAKAAQQGMIVTLGVAPTHPETGYGYIHTVGSGTVCRVDAFKEKPDAKTAERYLSTGEYFWNSGIFVLKASVWISALQQFCPDIACTVESAWNLRREDSVFLRPGSEAFAAAPSDSIDYAVMERCCGLFPVGMVRLDTAWNDLGSWDAVWQGANKDVNGNVCIGNVAVHNGHNVLVQSTGRLVNVMDLNNIVVVETPDAVLVSDRTNSQHVRTIVKGDREEHVKHRKVHRPWGWYDNIDQGSRFKVKRIMVKPGASLSLQRHAHRAEHWVVVSGVAEITRGKKTVRLYENQSTYIPVGEIHRLANPGSELLEIIEVQSGDYLGEDDIERLDDPYKREVKV